MDNRRRLKRQQLIYYLKLFDTNSSLLTGHLVDITTEGCLMISKRPCDVNHIYSLRLVLPNAVKGKMDINFQALAVWCGMDVNPDYHSTGFQFIEIFQEDLEIIDQVINRFGYQE